MSNDGTLYDANATVELDDGCMIVPIVTAWTDIFGEVDHHWYGGTS